MIREPKLGNARLRRDRYGVSPERSARLPDQRELQIEELEAAETEDAPAAQNADDGTTRIDSFTRGKPSRKPFPEHLPRERVVAQAPSRCSWCGSDRIVKMGGYITQTPDLQQRMTGHG